MGLLCLNILSGLFLNFIRSITTMVPILLLRTFSIIKVVFLSFIFISGSVFSTSCVIDLIFLMVTPSCRLIQSVFFSSHMNLCPMFFIKSGSSFSFFYKFSCFIRTPLIPCSSSPGYICNTLNIFLFFFLFLVYLISFFTTEGERFRSFLLPIDLGSSRFL